MRRILSKVVINLLAIAIAVPATLACAAPSEEASVTATSTGTPPAAFSLRVSTDRAVAATLAASPSAAKTADVPARSSSSKIRAQSQGGGVGRMVVGLVTTVIGIGSTVYMVKYLKDQQKKTDGQ